MKKNSESNERYVPPRIKMFTVATRSNILQSSSIIGYREDGSSSDNDGYGYDME